MSKSLTHRGRLNALQRYRPADDPEVRRARVDLKACMAEAYIRRVVAEAPPLSNEQRDRLAVLLLGGTP